jgi:hypothetical protein
MNAAAQLVDHIRALDAQAAGKRVELAMLLGQREEAQRYLREMNAITEARRAAKLAEAEERGECFFCAAGAIDGAMPHA